MFREHGIEVPVAEIAEAAGVGRGTLFRNFPTKDHLIAAVVSELMLDAVDQERGKLAESTDDAELTFDLIGDIAVHQHANRSLLESISDEFLAYPEMCEAHEAFMELLAEALRRSQAAGSVRPEITPMDVMMLMKGICMNPIFEADPSSELMTRQIELIRAAISTPAFSRPLRGTPPPVPA